MTASKAARPQPGLRSPATGGQTLLRRLADRGLIDELVLTDTVSARIEIDYFEQLLQSRFMGIPETCPMTHLLIQADKKSFLYRQLCNALDGTGVHVVPSAGSAGFLRDPVIFLAAISPSKLQLVLRPGGHSGDLGTLGKAVLPRSYWPNLQSIQHDGGNFMVTPPVTGHPYGVIIVGQHGVHDSVDLCRGALLQPCIPIDVTEGSVHHVDENLALVGDMEDWALAVPSRALAHFLICAALKENSPLEFGCIRFTSGGLNRSGVTRAVDITIRMRNFCFERITHRDYADERRDADRIYTTNHQVLSGVLGDRPTLFLPHVPGIHPNGMNLVMVNGRALVPHQHSIRVPWEAAVRILGLMFRQGRLPRSVVRRLPARVIEGMVARLAGQHKTVMFHLATGQRLSLADIARTFGVCDTAEEVPGVLMDLVRNRTGTWSRNTVITGPATFHLDAEGTVDILEACIYVLITALGVECRFVDTAFLSFGGGNLHCATNRITSLRSLGWNVEAIRTRFLGPQTDEELGDQ
ncbi:MAG: hypothetical protein V6Z89_10885 [Desulfobacter sp.]